MSHYMRIGEAVPFGESLVELEHVKPLHDLVLDELFIAARSPQIYFSDVRDSVAYSFYFRPIDEQENDFYQRHVTAKLAHESQPESWRLTLNIRTMNDLNRYSNRLERFCFETLGEELVQAKKEVCMVLGSAATYFDTATGELTQNVTTLYRMYEKPLRPNDCEQLYAMLGQTVARAAVARR